MHHYAPWAYRNVYTKALQEDGGGEAFLLTDRMVAMSLRWNSPCLGFDSVSGVSDQNLGWGGGGDCPRRKPATRQPQRIS